MDEIHRNYEHYAGRVEEDATNHALCALCGGSCCRRIGGAYAPIDFESITFEALSDRIAQGYISIDRITEQRKALPFLRARRKDAPIVDYAASDGPCCLLKSDGCIIPFEKRPLECRSLIPGEDQNCVDGYSRECAAWDRLPHKPVLMKLARKFSVQRYP